MTPPPVDPRSLDGLARRHLFGLDLIDAPDLDAVTDALLAHGERHDRAAEDSVELDPSVLDLVLTPNVDILVDLEHAPDSVAAEVFRRAHYVLPDGMPIVAVSRWLGRPLAARLPGSGLFEVLWPRVVAEHRPAVVLCANDGIAERLGSEHPIAELVVPPYIDAGDDVHLGVVAKELVDAAERIDAELVFLGLGHPKDALLAGAMQRLWGDAGRQPALCLGLGGSFAMYVGQKKRAPDLVQRFGMEWFYRFLQEPRRLFRRYFIDDLAFFGIVRREWAAGRKAAGR